MKRIALMLHGGIAPPGSIHYTPALTGLVRRLATQFDVAVFQLQGDAEPYDQYRCGNAAVHPVGATQGSHLIGKTCAILASVLRHHRERPFALVHGFGALPGGMAAVLAGRRAGIPSVVSLLGGEAANLPGIAYGNMRTFVTRFPTIWACQTADVVTVLTNYQLGALRRHGFERERGVHVISFGPEDHLFTAPAGGTDPPPWRILHVGSLNRVKDQKTLLRAFRLICGRADAYLRIVGVDTLGGTLQDFANDLGLAPRVAFVGHVPHEKLAPHFSWADLVMHSSLYEGEGVVFAEAAAAGVPVCGTRVGLLADWGESLAATAEPGDYVELGETVLRLIADPSRRERNRAQARKWAEDHRAEKAAETYARLYDGLLLNTL